MSGQSKKHSLFEAWVNVAAGFGIALSAQLAIFPVFDINISLSNNLLIGAFFTVVSLIRSYVLRRIFNAWHVRQDRLAVDAAMLADMECDRW